MLIRTGDIVEVIAGADSGVQNRVIKVDRGSGRAIVEGVARVYKHVRRSQKYPQGGRLSKEMPVQLSNLLYFCSSCGRGVRLGVRFRCSNMFSTHAGSSVPHYFPDVRPFA